MDVFSTFFILGFKVGYVSLFLTITHKVLVVEPVDYCMAVCLSAMTAVERHPKAA